MTLNQLHHKNEYLYISEHEDADLWLELGIPLAKNEEERLRPLTQSPIKMESLVLEEPSEKPEEK